MSVFGDFNLSDILKASAAQALALAVACGAFLYFSRIGVIPPLDRWMIAAAWFGLLFGGALWTALMTRAVWNTAAPVQRWTRWRSGRARRKAVANYIPHMTEEERGIVGYLLHHNQKSFDCDIDGGYAASLLARGIVRNGLTSGQVFDPLRVPMMVPDDVWEVLARHRDEFPAPKDDTHPWRVPWQLK